MGVPARGELVDAAPDGAEVLVVEEKPQLAPGVAVVSVDTSKYILVGIL